MADTERPVGRREQNKADKWQRILDAATRLFAEQGYAATTTTQIAKAARIGTGSLFLYVPSKEHLLVAVFRDRMDAAWAHGVASADPGAPLVDQVVHAFGVVFDMWELSPELMNTYLKVMPFVSLPARADIHAGVRQHMAHLNELLERARSSGALARTVSTEVLAVNLYAFYFHHLQRGAAGHVTPAQARQELRASVELQLQHLVPRRRRS